MAGSPDFLDVREIVVLAVTGPMKAAELRDSRISARRGPDSARMSLHPGATDVASSEARP
jgi:hypothetical protein